MAVNPGQHRTGVVNFERLPVPAAGTDDELDVLGPPLCEP